MENDSFGIDWRAFWIVLGYLGCLYIFWQATLRYAMPRLRFSSLESLSKAGWRRALDPWVHWLGFAALACFVIAFLNPHLLIPKQAPSEGDRLPPTGAVEGIAIYLLLDHSGSMQDKVTTRLPDGSTKTLPKIDVLKQVTRTFVQGEPKTDLKGRPNDMIGIIAFARSAQVISPLTLDHRYIIEALQNLEVTNDADEEGTSLGYAVYKAAHILAATRHYAQDLAGAGKPAYDIKSAVMILVTDGLQETNPKDTQNPLRAMEMPEAAAYAKEQGIRLYIVNVDPEFAQPKYAPNLRQLEQATESTGGHFFLVDSSTSLAEIYAEIDKLEKSRLPGQADVYAKQANLSKEMLPHLFRQFPLAPYLIALGLAALLLRVFLRSTLVRRVP